MNVLEDFELFLVAMAMIELLKARLVKETHNSQMQLVDHLMSHFVLIRHIQLTTHTIGLYSKFSV